MSTEKLIIKIKAKIERYDNSAANMQSASTAKEIVEKEKLEVYQSLLQEANKYLDRKNPVDRFF